MVKVRTITIGPDGEGVTAKDEELRKSDMSGITPDQMMQVMRLLPEQMNPLGIITLFVNIMANFDLLCKSPTIVSGMVVALRELSQEQPELFEEDGVRRAREKRAEEFLRNMN